MVSCPNTYSGRLLIKMLKSDIGISVFISLGISAEGQAEFHEP